MNKIPDKIKKDMAMDRIGRKLCAFLEGYYYKEVIEFRVAMLNDSHFIIHPISINGETLDVKWDFKNVTYGNEVFGYTNKGNEFYSPEEKQTQEVDELRDKRIAELEAELKRLYQRNELK